jgi:hypothetical protein
MQLSRTECKKTGVAFETWKRRRYKDQALNIMWHATRKRGEKATAVEKLHATDNEVGVGKESCM